MATDPGTTPTPLGEELRWGSPALGWPSNPFPAYSMVRERCPVLRVALPSGRRVWLVTGFEEARLVLGDARFSTDGGRFFRRLWGGRGPAGAEGPSTEHPVADQSGPDAEAGELESMSLAEHMLSTDPPDHTRLRRLVSQAFTLRRVEALRPRVEAVCAELLDGLADRLAGGPAGDPGGDGSRGGGRASGRASGRAGGRGGGRASGRAGGRAGGGEVVDLIEAFAFPLPVRVICELLGVPPGDEARFSGWFKAMISPGAAPDRRAEAQHAAIETAGYLASVIATKRRSPADDLLSALVAAQDGAAALSEAELMSMVFLLLFAGHETTVNLIGNGMVALLTHPDQLALLRRRPDLLPLGVEELLRFDGPVHHPMLRFALEAVTVGTAVIPAGDVVLVSLGAANRDRARFSDPERLDLERAEGAHLGFGHGPHFCLGAPLARMEGRLALGKLLERFGSIELAVDPAALRWRQGIFLRGLEALPVRLGAVPMPEAPRRSPSPQRCKDWR